MAKCSSQAGVDRTTANGAQPWTVLLVRSADGCLRHMRFIHILILIGSLALVWPWSRDSAAQTKEPDADLVTLGVMSLGPCVSPGADAQGRLNAGPARPGPVQPLHAAFNYHVIAYDLVSDAPTRTKIVTTGSPRIMARVWDMRSGLGLGTFGKDTSGVTGVAFSTDHAWIAITGASGEIQVADAATGQTLKSITAHQSFISAVSFSPDGGSLASGGRDGTIRLWDWRNGRLLLALAGHQSDVLALKFSNDGTTLVSTSRDGSARVWKLPDGQAVATFLPPGGSALTAAFSPDGRLVVLGSQFAATTVWSVPKGKLLAKLDGSDDVSAVAFSPDGRRFATGEKDGSVKLWSVDSWQVSSVLKAHEVQPMALAFNSDGTRLLTGSTDETAREWDVPRQVLLSTLDGPRRWLRMAAISPGGSHVLTGSDQRGLSNLQHLALLWSRDGKQAPVPLLTEVGAMESASFSPDGSLLLVKEEAMAVIFDVDSGQAKVRLEGRSWPSGTPSFSTDGQLALLPSVGLTRVWDARSGLLRASLQGEVIKVASFIPDLPAVLVSTNLGGQLLWSLTSNRTARMSGATSGNARLVEFGLSGTRFITVNNRGDVQVWTRDRSILDLRSVESISNGIGYSMAGLEGRAFSPISLSPDGTKVILLREDGNVYLYDERFNWKPEMLLEPASGIMVGGLGWLRDGKPTAVTCNAVYSN